MEAGVRERSCMLWDEMQCMTVSCYATSRCWIWIYKFSCFNNTKFSCLQNFLIYGMCKVPPTSQIPLCVTTIGGAQWTWMAMMPLEASCMHVLSGVSLWIVVSTLMFTHRTWYFWVASPSPDPWTQICHISAPCLQLTYGDTVTHPWSSVCVFK